MIKFNTQDRLVLDEMVAAFKKQMDESHELYKAQGKTPIITREYWLQMISELQSKIDLFTTTAAIKVSNQYK